MEALYQSVYAQVFASKWSNLINYPLATRMALAREDAENAAAAAVSGVLLLGAGQGRRGEGAAAVKLVYVAGPYRATTVWGVEQNILAAQAVGAQVLAIDGLHPVIPHMNTRQMEGIASDEQVLAGTLEMLRRCDAVIIDGRWESSAGTRGEVAEALRLGLPILYAWGDESYSAGILRDLAATPAGYRVPPGACDPQRERFWMGRRAGADEMLIRLGPSPRPRP